VSDCVCAALAVLLQCAAGRMTLEKQTKEQKLVYTSQFFRGSIKVIVIQTVFVKRCILLFKCFLLGSEE
jgi:hypothetical protein